MALYSTVLLLTTLIVATTTDARTTTFKDTDSYVPRNIKTSIKNLKTAEVNNMDVEEEKPESDIGQNFDFDVDEDEAERYSSRLVVADEREVNNPMVNQHLYSYLLNKKDGCPNGVYLLGLIQSSPHKFMERQEIRKTWGSVAEHNGRKVVPVFIMGKFFLPNATDIENELIEESIKYGDIVQGDFVDHYKNKTYKSIMGLVWAKTYCNQASYILNTNDETLVDIYHLIDFLADEKQTDKDVIEKSKNFLYCSTFFDQGPVRNPGDKKYVTLNEYPYEKFPPHCEDFGNVMSKDVVKNLLAASKTVPFLWLDDVFTTGFLALKAGIKHCDMTDGHSYQFMHKSLIESGVKDSVFLLANYKRLRKNWDIAWKAIQSAH